MRTIAYLDANSGSLIAGAIAAGAAGFAVFFKQGLHRFTGVFKRKPAADDAAAAVVAQDAPAAAVTPPDET